MSNPRLVDSPAGTFHGSPLPSGGTVFAGIPFAAPPVGPLRLRPPQPPQPRSGVRDATRFRPAAAQRVSALVSGQATPASFPGAELWAPPADCDEDCLYGPALTARAALPALVASGGHLVLTGSAAGRGIRPGNLYSATKWAVTGLAQSIRAECVGTGVRVTLVQPGLVDTGGIPPERSHDPKLDPADIARAVLYAVSQPATVDVNEILIRPVGQDAHR